MALWMGVVPTHFKQFKCLLKDYQVNISEGNCPSASFSLGDHQ